MTVYRIVLKPRDETANLEPLTFAVATTISEMTPVAVVVEDDHLVMTRTDGSYWPASIISQLDLDFTHGRYHHLGVDFDPQHEPFPLPSSL
jgi:hypothetical protein